MSDGARLRALLDSLDGRSYRAFRDIEGDWQLGDVLLSVEHVQSDPFAPPSRVSARIALGLEPDEAAEDFLLRWFGEGVRAPLRVYRPGPEVCERSALRLDAGGSATVRFAVGLPARGRRILGRQASELLLGDVVAAVERLRTFDPAALEAHVASVRVQRSLRSQLRERGLVAFVADGSVLPRRSGVDQAPLPGAVPFVSPASQRVTLETEEGPVSGMGLPRGVTLIVGGGFHGKSTLLQALQRGHLDHVPSDGRERVVADPDTVKIRAEDGRRVEQVDISAFLSDLPGGRATAPFRTDDASGSTSQAAALVEALESGARVLLLDEDSSATNLLVRDERMRRLIPRDREPITPLVERVRELAAAGVSTVMVVGGVGDWLAVADVVVAMEDYVPRDVSAEARAVAGPRPEPPAPMSPPLQRVLGRRGLQPGKIRARDTRAVRYGDADVDLVAVEQVLDASHAWTLGQALRFLHDELVDGRRTVRQLLDALDAILDDEGVEALSPFRHPPGDLVRPRRHEVAAALNRLRTLTVYPSSSSSSSSGPNADLS